MVEVIEQMKDKDAQINGALEMVVLNARYENDIRAHEMKVASEEKGRAHASQRVCEGGARAGE